MGGMSEFWTSKTEPLSLKVQNERFDPAFHMHLDPSNPPCVLLLPNEYQ